MCVGRCLLVAVSRYKRRGGKDAPLPGAENLFESISQRLFRVQTVLVLIGSEQRLRYKGAAAGYKLFYCRRQPAVFLPVVLEVGIVSVVAQGDLVMSLMQSSHADTGAISSLGSFDIREFLLSTSMSTGIANFIISAIDRMYTIVVSSGVQILVFLAGLQSVPPQLYESAHVEGCSGWEAFWKITLPMISPLILVNGIYTIVDSSSNSTNQIMSLVVSETETGAYSHASAMAMVYLAAVALIMGLFYIIARRLVFYQD